MMGIDLGIFVISREDDLIIGRRQIQSKCGPLPIAIVQQVPLANMVGHKVTAEGALLCRFTIIFDEMEDLQPRGMCIDTITSCDSNRCEI